MPLHDTLSTIGLHLFIFIVISKLGLLRIHGNHIIVVLCQAGATGISRITFL